MKDNYRDGDIVRWSWNDEALKKLDHKRAAGTLYWCQSQIAIFSESLGVFVDTYWHSPASNGFRFNTDTAKNEMHIFDVANLDELEECRKYDFNYYESRDCVNLSHPNMTRGGFYIRKGASKSIDKMKRVIEAHIQHHQAKAESSLRQVASLSKELESISVDSYLPYDEDVFVS